MSSKINIYVRLIFFIILCFINFCSAQSSLEFNAAHAFSYLEKQCEFGPRNPGSPGHQKCLEYLTDELQKYSNHVFRQNFRHTIRPGQQPVVMSNIIARFQLSNPNRILLCAHWDTRPWADQDPNPANRDKPIIGANDGASGVAVLLEVARIIHQCPPPYGIDIVLFDGEDFGNYGNNNSWAIGSREFAREYGQNFNPQFGILLDLIGDKDQQLYIEENSFNFAPEIVNKIWRSAEKLGISEFISEIGSEIMDDHIRLFEVGIPCVDIIDLDYLYWHTIEDTPDKCSTKSLGNVGKVITAIIYDLN